MNNLHLQLTRLHETLEEISHLESLHQSFPILFDPQLATQSPSEVRPFDFNWETPPWLALHNSPS